MAESLTRRGFVKAAAAVDAGVALESLAATEETSHLTASTALADETAEEQEHTCTCGWSCSFCQYHIYTRNGNVSHMLPKPDFDYRTCLKGRSRIQRTYSEARIRYPMKRVDGTPRGGGEWERITWDEAVQLIVDQWKKTEADFGLLANTYYQGGGGAQGSLNGNAGLIMRLFNALGCTKWDYSFDVDYIENEFDFAALLASGPLVPGTPVDDSLDMLERFIHEHLLLWVPGFCTDIERETRSDYYQTLAALTATFMEALAG